MIALRKRSSCIPTLRSPPNIFAINADGVIVKFIVSVAIPLTPVIAADIPIIFVEPAGNLYFSNIISTDSVEASTVKVELTISLIVHVIIIDLGYSYKAEPVLQLFAEIDAVNTIN